MLADMQVGEDGRTYDYGLTDKDQLVPFVKELAAVFPYADRAGSGVSYQEESHPQTHLPFVRVKFRLTRWMRLLAWVQDVDFTAPIWVNAAGLVLVVLRWRML
jgi:hypothetical protein